MAAAHKQHISGEKRRKMAIARAARHRSNNENIA
jgi:hypothetical protein